MIGSKAFWDGFWGAYAFGCSVTAPIWVATLLKLAIWDGYAPAMPLAFMWAFIGVHGVNGISAALSERRSQAIDFETVGRMQ